MIPLTHGKVAIVDDEDYGELMKYKWYASRDGNRWYAMRKGPRHGGRQKTILMHRFLIAGDSTLDVDHIHGDGLDNRRENLRLTTRSGNLRNRKSHRAGRLVGSRLLRGRNLRKPWQARIRIGGTVHYLGMFATEQEAHERFLRADMERNLALHCWAAL